MKQSKEFSNWSLAIIAGSIVAIIISLVIYTRLKLPYLPTRPADSIENNC